MPEVTFDLEDPTDVLILDALKAQGSKVLAMEDGETGAEYGERFLVEFVCQSHLESYLKVKAAQEAADGVDVPDVTLKRRRAAPGGPAVE